ncbi:MAG: extracellular solute-binding protein [Acetatifactor sp.]|nr:extracellular solute-binding protein [Acetatifactor sp.]
MKKKLLSLLLVGSVLMSLTACGNGEEVGNDGVVMDKDNVPTSDGVSGEEKEPITLSVFFKSEFTWDTAVAEEITRRTGVTLEPIPVAGDAAEKLNLMMISGQIPDIVCIDRGAEANAQYISNGKVIALDELLDSYGSDIKEQLGETLNKVRNVDDGKVYGLPSWFQNEMAPSPVFAFNIRMNYVKELGYYDTYVDKGYFTQDEFVTMLKEFKEKYPTINGNDSIAMAFNVENDGDYTWPFRGMYGIKAYYESDGQIYDSLRNPKNKEMYLLMNELYRENLIDKDWPVTKKTLYDEKIANGYVFSSPAAYWNIPNAQLKTDADGNVDIDNQMFPFLVTADGVTPEETTYGPSTVLGWTNTYISSTNKNPERTMEFLNFLMSEEGQYLTQWGVEGEDWNMVDGKRVVSDEMKTKFDEGKQWDYFGERGIRKYEIVFKSGIAKDGQYYDLDSAYKEASNSVEPVDAFARKYLGSTAYDTTEYDDLSPDAGTPEALINTKINDLKKAAFPKIILAESREEAEKLYDKLVEEAENSGMDQVEKIANEKHARRMSAWGK